MIWQSNWVVKNNAIDELRFEKWRENEMKTSIMKEILSKIFNIIWKNDQIGRDNREEQLSFYLSRVILFRVHMSVNNNNIIPFWYPSKS